VQETDSRIKSDCSGGDPSMLDPKIHIYGRTGELVVADKQEGEEWRKIGFRKLMRATKLTQAPINSILSGKGVRKQTMKVFRIGAARDSADRSQFIAGK